jgi:hypothetical protein
LHEWDSEGALAKPPFSHEVIAVAIEAANFIEVQQRFDQSAAFGPMEGAANADGRRRSMVINRLHTRPRMMIRAPPTPQTAQTATDSPSAKAGAWLRARSKHEKDEHHGPAEGVEHYRVLFVEHQLASSGLLKVE